MPVALSDLFRVVLGQVQGELDRHGATVLVQENLTVGLGHSRTLVQVVTNLLTNAVKFVPPGMTPRVNVWSEQHGTRTRVYVQDNGIGIDERHRERIWRVFERLHTREEYPGTGVGLAIVKKAIERMSGTVGVEASAPSGSCFWFELPTATENSKVRA